MFSKRCRVSPAFGKLCKVYEYWGFSWKLNRISKTDGSRLKGLPILKRFFAKSSKSSQPEISENLQSFLISIQWENVVIWSKIFFLLCYRYFLRFNLLKWFHAFYTMRCCLAAALKKPDESFPISATSLILFWFFMPQTDERYFMILFENQLNSWVPKLWSQTWVLTLDVTVNSHDLSKFSSAFKAVKIRQTFN